MIQAKTEHHAKVIESYFHDELSLKDVMKIHGISRQRIYQILHANNIDTRLTKRFSPDKIKLVVEDYINDYSMREVARKYNIPWTMVRRILVDIGIKIRRHANESKRWHEKVRNAMSITASKWKGCHHSKKSIEKMSKQKMEWYKKNVAPMKGHHHTEETKMKMRKAQKNRPIHCGWHHTEETKIKMRLSQQKRRQLEKENPC